MNYSYDRMGRMTLADYRHGTPAYAGAGLSDALAFPLSLSNVNDLDTRVAYDLNGRITGKRSGGVSSADSAVYEYREESYRLSSVQGKLSSQGTRDASRFENFRYDELGRMTQDLSKDLEIAYGADGMPVEMSVRAGQEETALHPLYDASGYRVSQVAATRLAHGFPAYWVGTQEGNEPDGMYTASSIEEALSDASFLLYYRNYPAPDSLVLYVVADLGQTEVTHGLGELTPLMKGDTVIPVVLRGVVKDSPQYVALMAAREGRRLHARHEVSMDGWIAGEVREVYDTAGAVASSRAVGNVYGRGAPIGRVVETDTGTAYQFYVKNHLGSTVRVVNADGSYATTPTFDYQPYGELQSIREDSANPVTQKFTGKGIDTEVNLYYFGARWYDQELGMWISPDAYGEFLNPYGRSGNPVRFVDAGGNCEIVCISIIVGVAAGAYFGGAGANGSYDPTKWDYSETWDEILVGGVIGGAAGGIGAAAGVAFGATAGLAAGSTTASALGNLDDRARGRDPRGLSTNFGAFDIKWGAKDPFDWNNPYDEGDPWYNPFQEGDWKEDLGDMLGWFANAQDVGNALAPSPAEANASAAKKGENRGYPILSKGAKYVVERSNYIGSGGAGIPKDMSDYFAYLHDLAYQKLGLSGPTGLLFNASGIGADLEFVMAQLKMAGGFTRGFDAFSNTMIGWRQMTNAGFYGVGLGALATPKILNTVGQGAYNNGY